MSRVSECPTAQPVACVSASSGSPLTNTTQVFQSDTASGALGGLYDLFAYPMILMLAKAGLFLAGPLDLFPRPLGPLALKSLPLQVVPAAHVVDRLAAVLGPITIGGDVGDAQVNTEEVGCGDRRGLRHIRGDDQEPLAIGTKYKVRLSLGDAIPSRGSFPG